MFEGIFTQNPEVDVEDVQSLPHDEERQRHLRIRDDVILEPNYFIEAVVGECLTHFILADIDSTRSQYAESIAREESRKACTIADGGITNFSASSEQSDRNGEHEKDDDEDGHRAGV